jgi:hypothetical protein
MNHLSTINRPGLWNKDLLGIANIMPRLRTYLTDVNFSPSRYFYGKGGINR